MRGPIIDISIVGAQKSGTTWLAESLDFHPSINLAVGKEAHFFDSNHIQRNGLSLDEFSKFFECHSTNSLNLDATPSYMYLEGSMAALAQNNLSAKVICIIRDPSQRAISQYYHSKRQGREARSLIVAILIERTRLRKFINNALDPDSSTRHHSYVDRGRYLRQILEIKELFPEALFIPFPLITSKPEQVLEQVQQFLEVEVIHLPVLSPRNYHGPRPKHFLVKKLISVMLRKNLKISLKTMEWDKNILREQRVK